jgi:hypothetical protein
VYENNVYFNEWGNDTLFRVSGDSMTAKLVIDLGDLKLNPVPDLSHYTPLEALRYTQSETALSIGSIWEDPTCYYIKIKYGYVDKQVSYCLYNKHTGDFVCLGATGLTNNFDGGLSFFPWKTEPDGTKIMWKDAADFREEILSKDYETQKAKYGERFEKVYQLALSLQEDDNPVLILVK